MVSDDAVVARAYAHCERLAREHYENFPVASRFLPAAMRPHIAAIYAFARTADDYADEPGMTAPERIRRLDAWGQQLAAVGSGCESCAGIHDSGSDPVFVALGQTIRHSRSLVNAVNFGGKPAELPPLDERGNPAGGPANRRAELWLNLKTALEQGRFACPIGTACRPIWSLRLPVRSGRQARS